MALLPLLLGCTAMGSAPSGSRLARIQRSPQWRDGEFRNSEAMWKDFSMTSLLAHQCAASDHDDPEDPDLIPVVPTNPELFRSSPSTGLRITWFGHSSMLLEIDGLRLLIDPVWGNRASFAQWAGPRRWYAPPMALEDMPTIDAVVISHDHYDHLDHTAFETMASWNTRFIVPLGVGAHLEHWGVPPERIVELDWWEETSLGGLRLVCTPARHASGRRVFNQNQTLWAGWAFVGPEHRVFYSGDTGLFDGLQQIGETLGPFDLTMLEVGAYSDLWPDWHLGPEQAVIAHQWLRGEVMLPVHWGLFNLAYHGWTEPAERTLVAANEASVRAVFPRPGESLQPSIPLATVPWWPEVPWETAEQSPIVASDANGMPPRLP